MTRLCTDCGKRDGRLIVHTAKPAPGRCSRCAEETEVRPSDCYREEMGDVG
ncbi:hypothetical protein [Algimonas porphyrae]|uniref:hypothetical protein n=1 Tax=Algimonas porphyrae TaxID=1128113 RepID=UPI00367284B1